MRVKELLRLAAGSLGLAAVAAVAREIFFPRCSRPVRPFGFPKDMCSIEGTVYRKGRNFVQATDFKYLSDELTVVRVRCTIEHGFVVIACLSIAEHVNRHGYSVVWSSLYDMRLPEKTYHELDGLNQSVVDSFLARRKELRRLRILALRTNHELN